MRAQNPDSIDILNSALDNLSDEEIPNQYKSAAGKMLGEMNADQLRSLGFPIDQVGKTVVSDQDLRRLIEAQNQASRRTFVFIPDE